KLACAVLEDDADDLLDLVMIGTIADMMPLIDENQAMINLGIAQLKKTKNLGLRKILQHSHLDIINETAIAFKIAPKINSSGRMNKAKDAVRLLTSTQESEANKLILEMELHHSHRKEITDDAYALCETLLDPLDGVIVVASPLLHEGIIGICAQKLVEKYQKTTCVIYVDDQGVGKGSMRAFGDDNALDLLQLAQDLLSRFGGHSQAAGFQLPQLSIPLLKARLNQSKKAYTKPVLRVDMEVLLKDIEIKTIVQLETYSFFTAKFLLQGLTVKSKTSMTDKHTKLVVSDGLKMYDAVLFNSLEYYYLLNIGDKVDIVGGLNVNSWKNTQRLQIMIKDLRCTHFQLIDFRQPSVYSQAAYQCGITQEPYVINDLVLLSNPDIFKKIHKEELQTVWLTPAHFYHDLIKYSNRVGLGELYRFVQTNKTIPMSVLQQKTGIHSTLLKALLEVFVQMKLISIVDGSIHYLPTYLKQDLEQSPAFQRFKKSADFIIDLYQSDESTLKSLFNHYWEA
ncbi:MAG: single-stranded-DNA-specific exonuclease C-terminal domain-containing protein, partial [Candidatus Izemoplasmatales bacterium]|nr:single-stranded-DNA-specific exonuclease C-terminal domain-containing protein [Candidatus Izemoplasmatales bacterium]